MRSQGYAARFMKVCYCATRVVNPGELMGIGRVLLGLGHPAGLSIIASTLTREQHLVTPEHPPLHRDKSDVITYGEAVERS